MGRIRIIPMDTLHDWELDVPREDNEPTTEHDDHGNDGDGEAEESPVS